MPAVRLFLAAIIGVAGTVLLSAADTPSVLSAAQPGLWEIGGLPGAKTAPRECVSDLLALARYEHRGGRCTSRVVKDAGNSVIVHYDCSTEGFGRSQVDVLTPRSLRISTQGISQSLPFNYVLQARRIGECPKSESTARH